MSWPVLIISPDRKLNAALANVIADSGSGHRPVFLEHYPTFAQLGSFLSDYPNAHAGVVGFAEPERAAKSIEILRTLQPDILAFGANIEPAPRQAAAALRAGAVDFLTPPWDPLRLRQRLEGVEFPSHGAAVGEGSLLVFLPAQGGDGASTTALHVASRLSELVRQEKEHGLSVLFSDFDFHAGATAFRLRLRASHNIVDALKATPTLDSSWPRFLSVWRDLQILTPPPSEAALSPTDALAIPDLFLSAKRRFRFTVLDFPPALYAACRDAVLLAERVFVVCSVDRISLHLAERRVRDLLQLGLALEQIKLLVNRADSEKAITPDQIPDMDNVEVMAALPNDYHQVSKAYLAGDLVDPISPYRNAVDDLAERIFRSL